MLFQNIFTQKRAGDVEKIGIIKEFDKLGRLVIPKELRERYSLDGKVEIIATPDGILVKNPDYVLTKIKKRDSLSHSDA